MHALTRTIILAVNFVIACGALANFPVGSRTEVSDGLENVGFRV